MPAVRVNGALEYRPGVYTEEEVISGLAGVAPDYVVPVILAGSPAGVPHDVASKIVAGETNPGAVVFRENATAAGRLFGAGYDHHVSHRYAERKGMRGCYHINLAPLTRLSIIVDASTVNQFTLYPAGYGAPFNWTKVSFASGVMEFTPLRGYAMLAANVGGGELRVYLTGVNPAAFLAPGHTVNLVSNTGTTESLTVKAVGSEITSTRQRRWWVSFTTAIANAHTTANYAMLVGYNEAAKVTSPTFTAGQGDELIDWINNESGVAFALKHANFSGALPDAVATATPLADVSAWSTVTPGTSPPLSGSELDTFITNYGDSIRADFLTRYGLRPYLWLLCDGTHTSHEAMRDWLRLDRANGRKGQAFLGTNWGDDNFSAANSTNSTWRAGQLNEQSVALWAGEIDRLAPYLSMAAQAFGAMAARGPRHNLTADEYDYEEITRTFTPTEETLLAKAGVNAYTLRDSGPSGPRYVMSGGANTNQANLNAWDEASNTTCLIFSRTIADYCEDAVRDVVVADQWGSDEVTEDSIAAVVLSRANARTFDLGIIDREIEIASIEVNASGSGYDVTPLIRVPTPSDFIVLKNKIIVGDQ